MSIASASTAHLPSRHGAPRCSPSHTFAWQLLAPARVLPMLQAIWDRKMLDKEGRQCNVTAKQ